MSIVNQQNPSLKEIRESFICLDCGVDTYETEEFYMLLNRVWKQINPASITGMLCLNCAEKRLGRQLVKKDFKRYPINKIQAAICPALAERLKRK